MKTLEETKYQEGIIPSLKSVAELIGEYDTTAVHALGALSSAGKTMLMLTLAYDYSNQTGRNACIFDTEAGASRFVKMWDKPLRKRFPKAKTPLVFMARNLKHIFRAHGEKLIWKVSDKGKISPSFAEVMVEGQRYKDDDGKIKRAKAPEFIQFIRDNNIGFVVYDSFSSPFATEVPANMENLGGRAFLQGVWLRKIIDLVIDKEGCIVWALHHLTKNPTTPQAREEILGGKNVKHYSKVQIIMKKFDAAGANTYRKLILARFYNEEEWTKTSYMRMTANGFIDASEEQKNDSAKEADKIRRKNKK